MDEEVNETFQLMKILLKKKQKDTTVIGEKCNKLYEEIHSILQSRGVGVTIDINGNNLRLENETSDLGV